jgi:hypothetical protein
VLGLIVAVTLSLSGCGDDDEGDATSGGDTGGVAAAPAPSDAFRDFSTAVEGQGLQVSQLPAASRHGAEEGLEITGSKSGTALLFSTEKEAQDYADEVAKGGSDKTKTVGTVVFVAPTQDDVDFFADAYEGG